MCAQASTHHWRNNTSSLSPTSLSFASQTVGTTSTAQTVTLANAGTTAISISSVAVSGNFSQSNNCGTSLAADARCTISVTFKPTASGTSTGSLSVTDSARSSAQTVSLTGTDRNQFCCCQPCRNYHGYLLARPPYLCQPDGEYVQRLADSDIYQYRFHDDHDQQHSGERQLFPEQQLRLIFECRCKVQHYCAIRPD